MSEGPRRGLRRFLPRPAAPARRPGGAPRPPAATRRHQRATPPNVLGAGPLIASPGLRLAVVVIIRDESSYLEEWLCYHHALGVDHVFLYDNGSDDGLRQLLVRWINHGLVTLIDWPLPGGQVDAYNHALRFFGPSVDWMAFFDVDEFVVPLVDDDIPSFLARFPDAADVRLPRKEFGFSGHRARPEGLVIEAYTGVADVFSRDPDKGARVKTIVAPRGTSAVGVHTATVADVPAAAPGETSGRRVPTRTAKRAVHGLAQLNHYYTRSFEEFEAKRFRGSATGRIPRPAVPFELATLETDLSAHRFIERTRAMMQRMHSLEPLPYHYGSQLNLAQFPHSNDLGLFAEFAIANVAAGLTELQREPSIRLANLWPATGFVGDLAPTGHAPRAADVSSSVHMAGLLEHIRGRIEASLPVAGDRTPIRAIHGAIRAARGAIEAVDGAWALSLDAGAAEVTIAVDSGGMRRCHALGFEVRPPAPLELELSLEHEDGAPTAPVVVRLQTGGPYAGIVEIHARPLLARRAVIRATSQAAALPLYDLFLVSYG